MESISSELAVLLKKPHCPKPDIVVGHSQGGITLRQFIHDHRSAIVGSVLVNVSHPDQRCTKAALS